MAADSITPIKHDRKWRDRAGERFGALVALSPCHQTLSSGRRVPAWLLRCDCGTEIVAMTTNLVAGKPTSCGCKRREAFEARTSPSRFPEYRVYRQMLDRCYLSSARNFRWYGAEGVTVCDRWRFGVDGLTGFECFIADLGRRPDGLTLERNDPRQPYGPSNCRWATWEEQAANKREHYLDDADRTRVRKHRAYRKVTPAMRKEILARLAAGEKQWPIARSLGLHQGTISDVKLGRR